MHFKLYQIDEQCQKYAMIGLIPFYARYYLDEKDEGYDRYLKEYYIEKEGIFTPFVTQQLLFESSHVDKMDNVLFCFDWALEEQYKNWLNGTKWTEYPLPYKGAKTVDEAYKKRTQYYLNNLSQKETEINAVYAKAQDCMMIDYKSISTDYRIK